MEAAGLHVAGTPVGSGHCRKAPGFLKADKRAIRALSSARARVRDAPDRPSFM